MHTPLKMKHHAQPGLWSQLRGDSVTGARPAPSSVAMGGKAIVIPIIHTESFETIKASSLPGSIVNLAHQSINQFTNCKYQLISHTSQIVFSHNCLSAPLPNKVQPLYNHTRQPFNNQLTMHGEYYQGSSLPASLGRGHKTAQTSQPIANKDAMASVATLVGDDASTLEKLDSSESKSIQQEFYFRLFQ